MAGMVDITRKAGMILAISALPALQASPAFSFCVRNDTGASIRVEALEGTAAFAVDIANNKKTCCQPKDEACALGDQAVRLSIMAAEGDATCAVTVGPKGNVNITGSSNVLKCKANKAGSTMDWASG